jgi:hypothetical protein
MVKIFALIAVFVALFCVYSIEAQSERPSPSTRKEIKPPQKYSPAQQQKPEPDKRGTEQMPFVVKAIPTPKSQAETEQDRKEHKEKTSQGWWIIWLTAVVAVATFLQAIFLFKSFRETRKAANAAKDSADALPMLERAYIFVNKVRSNTIIMPTPDEYYYGASRIRLNKNSFEVVIENYGKTPAIVKRIEAVANVFSGAIPHIVGIQYPNMPEITRIIASQKGHSFNFDFDIEDNQTLEKISSLERKLVCIGCIQYEDIFGNPHETGFCWWYEPDTEDFCFYDHPNNYRT